MSTRYRYATTLDFGEDEHEVEVSYTVAWGQPESGRGYMADPYLYDPGSPDEVECLRVELIDGKPAEDRPATFRAMILDALDREPHTTDMLQEARDREAAWAE